MALTNITRYKLRKLLKYAVLAGAIAGVLLLFAGETLRIWHFGWVLLGLWTGILEEFLFGRRFRALPIPLQLLGKVLLVNVLTFGIIAMAFAMGREKVFPWLQGDGVSMGEVFSMQPFYLLMFRMLVITSVTIVAVQLEEAIGRRMLFGSLLGWYDKPKAHERIVLTMDLQGSTALAERMGDLRYFRFLNFTHSLMSDAVLHNEAEIHKYVGDEVIFTWTMRAGARHHNCLDLCFDIADRIAEHDQAFKDEFGAVPKFRAAVHGGRVITAQVGHIKRAIDHSGDVMNAVSRMLGLCKDLNEQLLVSTELLERLGDVSDRFVIGPEQILPVKGRRREVRVHGVTRVRS
ncbi:MAG: adenylate/guanylate cyclase domain-containing protein [Flavobacteriales bacterium]|nr:adenylate/guanylate cyclase domain-containing protein [Flavobacteriales bacterium]